MKLSMSTLDTLAEMICGAAGMGGFSWDNFPYRSSSYLTQFFIRADLDYAHDGSTRQSWVFSVLKEINDIPSTNTSFPSNEMIRVIQQLANPVEFDREEKDHSKAIEQINTVLNRDGLQISLRQGQIVLENLRTQTRTGSEDGRLFSREEEARRLAFESFLENAGEDEFTEQILVKLFRSLGFHKIHITGHRDRSMEFGKDMWMKHRLPTGHQLYVGVQVKKGRIHASGSEITGNISGILAQLLMLMTYPVFDQETNTKQLFDHVFLVSSGEISKQARTLLSEFLDNAMRRNVMFMDRDDILDLCVLHAVPLPNDTQQVDTGTADDDIPF
jgi:hypothetical protein